MSWTSHAQQITNALSLEHPPVGLVFLDEAPEGLAQDGPAVPSSCAFWRRAETEIFFASAKAHFNCPIGAFVMGFDLPESVGQELGGLVGQIIENGYIGADEPANLPRWQKARAGILYGPLDRLPQAPDMVLLWLTPAQAMVWNEASGGASWGGQTPVAAFGRPACSAIPASYNSDRPTISLGCAGMRTFTGIPDGKMLAAIPGARLAEAVASIGAAAELNVQMRAFYRSREAALAER